MKRRLKPLLCPGQCRAGAGLPEEAALFAGVPSPRCVTRVEMAPKKGKGKKGGDDAGGKVKDPAPTEVEREELRLKIHILEAKLQEMTQKVENAATGTGELNQQLEKQQADQADIVDYLKKEIEKKTAENVALEKKYILLREAKENEEIRLQHELEVERSDGAATREAREKTLSECADLEAKLHEYHALKELKISNEESISVLESDLSTARAQLDMARTHLHILAAPEGDNVGEDGSFAVPLLLLEAMRMYSGNGSGCRNAAHARPEDGAPSARLQAPSGPGRSYAPPPGAPARPPGGVRGPPQPAPRSGAIPS